MILVSAPRSSFAEMAVNWPPTPSPSPLAPSSPNDDSVALVTPEAPPDFGVRCSSARSRDLVAHCSCVDTGGALSMENPPSSPYAPEVFMGSSSSGLTTALGAGLRCRRDRGCDASRALPERAECGGRSRGECPEEPPWPSSRARSPR